MERSESVSTQRLGRYVVVERLAVGGMAEVFLALEPDTGDIVVIKRILPHLAPNPEFVQAFAREARIAARIDHPNVIRIRELGAAEDRPYIVMEFVDGTTLKELLVQARAMNLPVPLGVGLNLLVQACAGAHAAHELVGPDGRPYGIVHRDITPHNLMVDGKGRLKLLDFGIAKAGTEGEDTRTGVLKGKIAYMSPEQCRQDPLDRRSDVFSLGVVGYQLLGGRKPFAHSSELATMQAIILGRYPPLLSLRPEIPGGVADAVERAMSGPADERFPSAEAFADALRWAAESEGIPLVDADAAEWVGRLLLPSSEWRRANVGYLLSQSLVSADADVTAEPNTESIDRATPKPPVVPASPPVAPARGAWPAILVLAAAVAMIAGTLLWAGARSVDRESAGGAQGDVAASAIPSPAPLRIVAAPIRSEASLRAELRGFAEYLSGALSRPIEIEIASSYASTAELVATGEFSVAILPPSTVAHARELDPAIEVLGVEIVDGSTSSDAYLLVRRDDPVTNLNDLRGQTACWVDPLSGTGYRIPRAWLREHGVDPDRDLRTHLSGDHEQALRDLLDGRCAVAATFSGNYLTANQKGISTARLKILAITGSSPHDAVVVSSSIDPALREAVRAAVLAYEAPPGAEVSGSGITGFARPPDGYPSLEER